MDQCAMFEKSEWNRVGLKPRRDVWGSPRASINYVTFNYDYNYVNYVCSRVATKPPPSSRRYRLVENTLFLFGKTERPATVERRRVPGRHKIDPRYPSTERVYVAGVP